MAAEKTQLPSPPGGYQNPPRLSPKTRTLISYHEFPAAAGVQWVFMKHQCLHCTDARCANVCAPNAYSRSPEGIVTCDSSKCVACAACLDECPFNVPTLEFLDLETPRIIKCDWCVERQGEKPNGNDKPFHGPACARACPTAAIEFGRRDDLLKEAKRRIAARPEQYIDHVYGEKELGGMGWMYLSHVPFEKLGLPLDFAPPSGPKLLGQAAPPGKVSAATAAAVGFAWFCQRRDEVSKRGGQEMRR